MRLLLAGAALALLGCLPAFALEPAPEPPTDPGLIGELRPGSGYLAGYLGPERLPDSAALLPPPPSAGDAREAADLQRHLETRALAGSARWEEAHRDNELDFPAAAQSFACVLGVPVTDAETPHPW